MHPRRQGANWVDPLQGQCEMATGAEAGGGGCGRGVAAERSLRPIAAGIVPVC